MEAARRIKLHVLDENGRPTMASFTVKDRWNRLYPSPSKRLAPDLFFQPQIYRADGETIDLPPGYYTITSTGGPEYTAHTNEFAVDANGPQEWSCQLPALDQSLAIRLVFRRSSCACRRVLALSEPG